MKAYLVSGTPNTGKTTYARNLNIKHLQIDDIWVGWKGINWGGTQIVANNINNPDYYKYHGEFIKNWVTKEDLVIEGYDLGFDDYQEMVKKILKGYKIINVTCEGYNKYNIW